MNFNKHYNLIGKHAFLGASQHAWLNYTPEKLVQMYRSRLAIERGTKLHELAAMMIRQAVTFGTKSKQTLKRYVDDAIRYNMTPEVILYYSDNCFGTADAISFNGHDLRIHDLKTGSNQASMKQLMIYAALFCLEYGLKPSEINIILRIYQNDDIEEYNATSEDIVPIMDKIKTNDKLLEEVKEDH